MQEYSLPSELAGKLIYIYIFHFIYNIYIYNLKGQLRISLVVQWLRIYLPTQETELQSLVQEEPTCHKATKPASHNYRAYILESMPCNKRTHCSETPQLEKVHVKQQRPSAAKNKLKKKKKSTRIFRLASKVLAK